MFETLVGESLMDERLKGKFMLLEMHSTGEKIYGLRKLIELSVKSHD